MLHTLPVDLLSQPDEFTCGPTCLQGLYGYFGDDLPLARVISEVSMLEAGGTLDVLLACHALRRGYRAQIYTYNLHLFDPTWFQHGVDIRERLTQQMLAKHHPKLHVATKAYLEFLDRGGQIHFEDLNAALIERYLERGIPILTGLSSTYLYRTAREVDQDLQFDDIRGDPSGHFVLLCGYNRETQEVLVADPLQTNPIATSPQYAVPVDRLICAILLGIVTYDANLLIIEPAGRP